MSRTLVLHLIALAALLAALPAVETKPRLIITTDIGGDPDDQQCLVRLMLFSNEFDIEALIASAAGTPGELGVAVTKPELIREIVAAYGQVRDNLALHAPGYPSAQYLLDRVYSGNKNRGTAYIGAAHDTAGSNRIIAVVDAADARPVHVSIWGGQTDLAQALWRVRNDRGTAGLASFIAKLRIYDIADQDGILAWMRSQFPGMWYVLSKSATSDKRDAAFRGVYLGGDETLTSRTWLDTHVRIGHGPLGPLYPNATWTDPNPYNGLKEGDVVSWFHALPHGLNDPEQPTWGGWGGRFLLAEPTYWRDASETVAGVTSTRNTVNRWRPDFQAQFQARMDWCVKPVAQANHAPLAVVQGVPGRSAVAVSAVPGATVALSATGSSDPDGHSLSYVWSQYREAGTYPGSVTLAGASAASASFAVPTDAVVGQTIHILLAVTDNGSPALTSYRRVVCTVVPGSTPPPPVGEIRINFQPGSAPVPSGYAKDDGSAFSSARGYGWGADLRANARDRNANSDQRLDTFVWGGSSTAYATWEHVLPNGAYLVSLAMGDANAQQGPQRAEVEGVRLIADVMTATNTFATATAVPVTVTDGRLTVRIGCVGSAQVASDGSTDSTLNYIIIKPVSATPPAPVAIRINFQPAAAAPVAGWSSDSGAVFAARTAGLSYGWNQDNAANSRERNSSYAPDQLHDTLNHLQKTAGQNWELALPIGRYEVRIVRGEPAFTDQVNHLLVEGVRLADPDGPDRFDEDSVIVEVADGRLTIAPAADALNAKLCCLEVIVLPAGDG